MMIGPADVEKLRIIRAPNQPSCRCTCRFPSIPQSCGSCQRGPVI